MAAVIRVRLRRRRNKRIHREGVYNFLIYDSFEMTEEESGSLQRTVAVAAAISQNRFSCLFLHT